MADDEPKTLEQAIEEFEAERAAWKRDAPRRERAAWLERFVPKGVCLLCGCHVANPGQHWAWHQTIDGVR